MAQEKGKSRCALKRALIITFWTLLTILALGLLCYKIATLVSKYLAYPKKSSQQTVTPSEQEWPTITLCSSKPLDVSSLQVMNDVIEGTTSTTQNDNLEAFKMKFMNFQSKVEPFAKSYVNANGDNRETRSDIASMYSFEGLRANIGEDTANKAGVELGDFVISCQFGTKVCDKLSVEIDKQYGRCFKLSVDNSEPAFDERYLELTLFAGASADSDELDLSPLGIQTMGDLEKSSLRTKVVLRKDDSVAKEFDLVSGFSYDVHMKESSFLHLVAPYGQCEMNPTRNESCKHVCLGEQVKHYCGCIVGFQDGFQDGSKGGNCLKVPDAKNECDEVTDTPECTEALEMWKLTQKCANTILENGKPSVCHCPIPCMETKYAVTMTPYPLTFRAPPPEAVKYWESLGDARKLEIQSRFDDFDLSKLTTEVKIRLDPDITVMQEWAAMTISDLLSELYFHFCITVLMTANLVYAICQGRRKH